MYAVIETGGKQYRVEKGDVLDIEKVGVEAGKKVEFDKVLLIGGDNGIDVGTPYLEGTVVTGKVIENGKGPKVVIFKYKNKKDYRKKQGHRQPYTRVEITDIPGAGKTAKAAKKEAPKKEEAKAEEPKKAEKAEKTEPKAEAPAKKKVSASWKKDELVAYAEEHGIEIDAKATKAVIIEAIENAEK